jgi:uncharacterized surface protein with fasciclin (FAS1) repeats
MKEKYNVVETATQAGHFRVFLQALKAAGLKETLRETGPYTILAPVDEAFVKIPKAKLEDLFKTANRESLRLLLRNHIVVGNLLSTDLQQHDEIRSMKGEELRIESRAGLWINEARVVTPDLKASNGVVHGLDTVLMSQTQGAAV